MDKTQLFIQAPTGIGKTSGVLFPALKAMGEGLTSRIFYATAKTITRTVALETIDRMRDKGLKLKTVVLTAKEKLCFKDECRCDGEYCQYARGYYDRIDEAIEDMYKEDSFTREKIEEYAEKYQLCPFELSLDLSLWADCIICDYNYIFDPRVQLKRFFMEGGDYTLLVDEGHNLVDRAREMYSAELEKKELLELKRAIPKEYKKLKSTVSKVNEAMIAMRKECEASQQESVVKEEYPKDFIKLIRAFVKEGDKVLSYNGHLDFKEMLVDLYFKAASFVRVSELYDGSYVTYMEKSRNSLKLKLFCIDPSKLLKGVMEKQKASIIFSATLSPMDYYVYSLGGNKDSRTLVLSSPFPKDNLCLIINDKHSTRYKEREGSLDSIAKDISTVIESRRGNYLVFFPSYSYMEQVYERFKELCPEHNTAVQTPGMNEEDKEEFLRLFSESESVTGFGVMGGMFSEGIDLTGDKLIGCIIIGVGLPKLCLERNIIRDYYNKKNSKGFEYSYTYPGMNKVLQAAGRVIRTENDKGIVMLIDDRFSSRVYKNLYPKEWRPVRYKCNEDLRSIISSFWRENSEKQLYL
jgi:DNA excision repair protein ERCC-2